MIMNFIDNEQDIYSIAMMLLYDLKDSPKYSLLSELSYVMDKDSFLKFINIYGGKTITVPTRKEISQLIRTMLYYQYKYVEGHTVNESKKMIYGDQHLTRDEFHQLKMDARRLDTLLSSKVNVTRSVKSLWST